MSPASGSSSRGSGGKRSKKTTARRGAPDRAGRSPSRSRKRGSGPARKGASSGPSSRRRTGAPRKAGARPARGPKRPRSSTDGGAGGRAGTRPAGRLRQGPGQAAQQWRDAVETARGGADRRPQRAARAEPDRPSAPPRQLDEWILVEEIRDEAEQAVERGERGTEPEEPARPSVDAVRDELGRAVGPTRVARLERRLREAADDFEAERFTEAARALKTLSEQAPGVAAVRELYGLTLYRLGRWKLAIRELEAFRALTGSTEQHPVLADAYRALRQWRQVDDLWDELRQASPSGPIVTEGRIVTAGSLADRGDLPGAIELLDGGWRFPRRPKVHHLRRAYALADLHERAGNLSRARELFARIRSVDPDFADVRARVRALG